VDGSHGLRRGKSLDFHPVGDHIFEKGPAVKAPENGVQRFTGGHDRPSQLEEEDHMSRNVVRLGVVVVTILMIGSLASAADAPDWAGTWQSGPATTFSQALSRFDGAYDPVSGLVYFLGGRLADNNTDGSVWSFNPATGIYADTGVDMPTPISNYTANVLTDSTGTGLYIFCGRTNAGGQTLGVQVYYPATNSVVQLPVADDFPGSLTCTSALNVVVGNKAYVAGGLDTAVSPYNAAETWVFDPMAASGSRWTRLTAADLAQGRAYIMGAAVDGKVYAVGGSFYDPASTICGQQLCNVTTVQVLDPAAATPTWTTLAALPEECSSSRAWGFDSTSLYQDPVDLTPLAGKIVTGCGWWPNALSSVYAYDVAGNAWGAFPSFITARRDQAGELLPLASDPAIWVWGGYDGTGANSTTVEFFPLRVVPVELQRFTVE
jgi:hypothetical protein